MSAIIDTKLTGQMLEQSTSLDSLSQNFQDWLKMFKNEIDKTDRLAKLVFDIKMKKWIEPIVREFKVEREGMIWDRKEVVDRESKYTTSEIELEKVNNIEDYDFDEEIQEISTFVRDGLSFGVIFEIHAYGANGSSLGHRSQWVAQLGSRNLAEIQTEVRKIGNKHLE